jgi:hypothetical protein
VVMNTTTRFNRRFVYFLICVLGAPVALAQQRSFAVEGRWKCDVKYEGGNYEFGFEAKAQSETFFRAYRKLINNYALAAN